MNAWITVPYVWHATALEAAWLISGVISAVITSRNLYNSWKDQASLELVRADPSVHDRHYEMIRLAAHGRTSSQMTRLAISALITLTGVVGVLQENAQGGRTTWTGLAVTTCLVAISVLTALRSYLDLRQRNLLYEMATKRTAVLAAKMRASEESKRQEAP